MSKKDMCEFPDPVLYGRYEGTRLENIIEYSIPSFTNPDVEYIVRLGGGVASCQCPAFAKAALDRAAKQARGEAPWWPSPWCKHLNSARSYGYYAERTTYVSDLTATETTRIERVERQLATLESKLHLHTHSVEFKGRLTRS